MRNKRSAWKDFEIDLIHKTFQDLNGKIISMPEAEKLSEKLEKAGGIHRTAGAIAAKYRYERWKRMRTKKQAGNKIANPKRMAGKEDGIEKSLSALMDTLKDRVVDLIRDYRQRGNKLDNLERIIKGNERR